MEWRRNLSCIKISFVSLKQKERLRLAYFLNSQLDGANSLQDKGGFPNGK